MNGFPNRPILTLVQGDKEALKLATLFQTTFPGAPCVYYGDEIGMEGRHDPDCRRVFPWDESYWDHDLLAFCRRAIGLRHEHPALRRGRYLRLHTDDQHGVYAFARQGEEETLVVVLNNGLPKYDLDVLVEGLFSDGTACTTCEREAGRRWPPGGSPARRCRLVRGRCWRWEKISDKEQIIDP